MLMEYERRGLDPAAAHEMKVWARIQDEVIDGRVVRQPKAYPSMMTTTRRMWRRSGRAR